MRIINVVEIDRGILNTVESFVIHNDTEHPNPMVEKAEEYFIKLIRDAHKGNSTDADLDIDEEIDNALENGSWENNSGLEYYLIWSNVNE